MKQVHLKALAILLAAVILALLVPLVRMYTVNAAAPAYPLLSLSDDSLKQWTVFTDEAGRRTLLEPTGRGSYTGLTEPGQTFYYACTLDTALDGAMLELNAASQSIAVFLDGALLYTDCPDADNRIGYVQLPARRHSRGEPVRISLPEDYPGRTLTIAQGAGTGEQADGSGEAVPCTVSLYAQDPAEGQAVATSFSFAYSLLALGSVCVLGAGLMVYQAFRGRFDAGLLFLALFALLWTYDVVIRFPRFEQYPQFAVLGQLSAYLSPHLSILSLLLFLLTRMDRWRRPFLAVVALMVLSTFAAWLAGAGVLPPAASNAAAVCRAAVLMASLVFAVLEARSGSFFFRVMAPIAAGLLALFALMASLTALSGGLWGSGSTNPLRSVIRTAIRQHSPYAVLILSRATLLTSSTLAVVATTVRDIVRRGAEMSALDLKYRLTQQSYQDLRARNDQVMMLRHDMRHHLTALSAMLSAGQTEKAAAYVRALTGREDSIPTYVNTGNDMIDVIVNSRLADAARAGVQIKVLQASAPARLPVSDQDLCSLLMNALDNACHASARAHQPRLTLDIHIKSGFFFFWLENTCPEPEVQPAAPAAAAGPQALPEHGYGLRSIESVAERCGGVLDIRREGTRFTLRLALPLGAAAGT